MKDAKLNIEAAYKKLKDVVTHTPLQLNRNLSAKYQCNVFLKREDLQIVRSYKLRGAYNMMSSLTKAEMKNGVVCASAGNHAQGFAYSCKALGIRGVVFMPAITPKQKVTQTKMFGGDNIEIRLIGDSFDDCAAAAKKYTKSHGMTFIPPFDDIKVIEGQGTVGVEILEDFKKLNPAKLFGKNKNKIDFLFMPVGGGGLSAGVGSYFKKNSADTKIIGLEAEGAPALYESRKVGKTIILENIDKFADGIAVKKIGDVTFPILQKVLDDVCLVPEGKICSTILKLYNEDAIVVEPAGAASIACLDYFADKIKGKNVVCVVSGSNNDIDRLQEIKERSLQYEGLKHYFLIRFSQRPGALKEFVNEVLGPTDDITRFEYIQKNNKEMGPALVGIELRNREDYEPFITRMKKYQIDFTALNKKDKLFEYLV
jgi:threonine dehydratase